MAGGRHGLQAGRTDGLLSCRGCEEVSVCALPQIDHKINGTLRAIYQLEHLSGNPTLLLARLDLCFTEESIKMWAVK